MRFLTMALLCLALACPAAAQVPRLLSVQGVLTDNAGNLVPNGGYDVTFRIFDVASGGAALYTENHFGAAQVQVVNGGFSVVLGSITPLVLTFDVAYHLEVQVGVDPPLAPRIALTSSPYAYMARNVPDNTISTAKLLTNAVTDNKIAPGAVTSLKVAANAITNPHLADDAVGSAEVLNGSLVAGDLSDEPGVASQSSTFGTTLNSTAQDVLLRTITVPSAGFVVAMADANVDFTYTQGTACAASLSVSQVADTHDNDNLRVLRLSNLLAQTSGGTGVYRFGVSTHAVFPVAGAGSHTIRLVGSSTTGVATVSGRSLVLMFFPTSYGTVSAPGTGPSVIPTGPVAAPDAP